VAQNGQGLLIIACGALAHEITALKRANAWDRVDVRCLPAELHNRPERIPAAVRALIQSSRGQYRSIFVAYGDCGTGGMLDAVLEEEGIERIPGAHCYEFFATAPVFAALAEAELGTFYLTDFLVRHFERLVIRGLGLDRHPELFPVYFGNYKKLVYLAQNPGQDSIEEARGIAARMGLAFEARSTGYGTLETALKIAVVRDDERGEAAARTSAEGDAAQHEAVGAGVRTALGADEIRVEEKLTGEGIAWRR
jgi:hypothetical protein